MTPVRLALVGAGKWGQNYIRTAGELGHAVKVIGRSDAIADADAVIIATCPSAAPALCELALAIGLPVLCEKPAGLSLVDAQRIANAERESSAFVLVGHQHLFADGFEALRAQGRPSFSNSMWTGPAVHGFSHRWDYGPHAVATMLALGAEVQAWTVAEVPTKTASVLAVFDDTTMTYDAYAATCEPPLTRQVRAFAQAVRAGGTDDYRFGAKWAVDVARVLESAQ